MEGNTNTFFILLVNSEKIMCFLAYLLATLFQFNDTLSMKLV